MDSKNLKSILHASATKKLPVPGQINLWPGVKDSLVARNHPLFVQGDSMNSQKINFRCNQMAALISLSLIFAVAVFFVTPQGRALAQEVLQFFSRSAQDTQPLPTLAAPVVTIDSTQSEAP